MTVDADRCIKVGGQEVFVSLRAGAHDDAPPLLLLMGLGGNVGMWEPLRGLLDASRPTVAFDIPGTGRSPATRWPRPLVSIARLTVGLLDELGLPCVDVMGVSWGGLLAQQLAVASRSRVRRVVLANTNFGVGSVPGSPAAVSALLNTRRYESVDGLRQAARAFGGHGGVGPGMARHAAARLAHPPSQRGYVNQILALAGWSSLPLLPLLRRPVLLLTGEDDRVAPPVNARIMAAALPRSEVVIVPGAGHLMLFDQAAEIAPIVTRFLA